MEGFTVIDGGALFVLVVSALLAYSRGFVREVLSIIGWVAAAVVAFIFAPDVVPLVYEIPYLDQIIETSCVLATMAAFGIVFVGALIVVSIFTPLISGAIQNSAIGPLDQGLGFLFGLARGALLIILVLILYDQFIAGSGEVPMIENSKTREILADAQANIANQLPEDARGWINDRYAQLTGDCEPPQQPVEAETPAEIPADGEDTTGN
ncbi:CvpA family protein [Algicella marina]|uniref:CvpA family protein n=1 Tax=Algicella marina TaxID=2683284 RepID=A0A6P1T070_9RHOB|nr:CvpA family protein [Algicella marina]QHQ34836.1 CvpA family protein [Algicella marina]